MRAQLMLEAGELGLDPYGLSFHVGSQQTTTHAYEVAIGKVAMLFTDLTEAGVNLRMINLGGGFPTRYRDDVPEIDQFGHAIMTAMTDHFGNALPEMVIEPGRFIVGDAGLVSAEVVLVSRATATIRCAGSIWISVASAAWPKPKANRSNIESRRHMMDRQWVRWRSPARPATGRTSCMRNRTTACRWH